MATKTVIAIALVVAACKKPTPIVAEEDASRPHRVEPLTCTDPSMTPESRRVIVPSASARGRYPQQVGSRRTFTPEAGEVAAFEAHLVDFLRVNGRSKTIATRAPTHCRQYVGWLDDRGARVVWGTFICSVFTLDGDREVWRKGPIEMSDGGDCKFEVEYLPAEGTFRNLRINGEG